MKTNINIYLSSTNFNYLNDPNLDVNWKLNLKKHFEIYQSKNRFSISFHDPLETISDQPEIVIDDINHIIDCDFVVSYFPRNRLTIGTIMELQYSLLNKPKNCVILIDRYRIHRKHPWIKYWVKHIVDNEQEAVSRILNILDNSNFTGLKEG